MRIWAIALAVVCGLEPAAAQTLPFVPFGLPEDSVIAMIDPVVGPRLRIVQDGFAAWVEAPDDVAAEVALQALDRLIDDEEALLMTDPAARVRHGAVWLAGTLYEVGASRGTKAALLRGDQAVAMERQLAANAFVFGDYFSGTDFPSIAAAETSAREMAINWALDEASWAREVGDGPLADQLELRAFFWAQTLLQGPAARAAVRPLRQDDLLPVIEGMADDMQRSKLVMTYLRNYTLKPEELDRATASADAAITRIGADLGTLGAANADLAAAILPRPLPLAELRALLQPDEALLLAVPDEFNYIVFAVSRESFAWHRTSLYQLDIDALTEDLLSGIPAWRSRGAVQLSGAEPGAGGAARTAMIDAAFRLHDEFLGPARAVIADKPRLLVAATGTAAHFPWSMLLASPAAADADFAAMDWVVRQHAVLSLPAIEALALRDTGRNPDALRYLGFGAPDFQAGAGSWAARAWGAPVVDLLPLPEAAGEGRDVGALYPAGGRMVLTGAEAREATLLDLSASGALPGYDILHFATHGMIWGDHPDVTESMVALTASPEWDGPHEMTVEGMLPLLPDGALMDSEIRQLVMAPALVILSACKTAAGQAFERDGVTGLAAAFLHAGAERVLATHWPVNSRAAVNLVTAMMAADPDLSDPADALRSAMLAEIAAGGRRADPAWWAPFSLIGRP